MEFFFLGTGNAFGHGGRRRSHYYWQHDEKWLIDASYDALSGLRSIGKNIEDVDRIFISHLHPDHFMGLPQFALENYYVIKKQETIPVYCPIGTKELVESATKLFFNEEVVGHLKDLYKFQEIGPNQSVEFNTGSLQTLDADHTGNARMQIIEKDGISLGYTGDTGFRPELFDQLLECSFVITEASSAIHSIPHHTTLKELQDYEIPKNKFVYISHIGESVLLEQHTITPPLYLVHDGMRIRPDQL